MLLCGVGLEQMHGCEVLIHHRLCPLHEVALRTSDGFIHDWAMTGEDPLGFVGMPLQHVAVSGWCHTEFSCNLNPGVGCQGLGLKALVALPFISTRCFRASGLDHQPCIEPHLGADTWPGLRDKHIFFCRQPAVHRVTTQHKGTHCHHNTQSGKHTHTRNGKKKERRHKESAWRTVPRSCMAALDVLWCV